MCKEVKVAEELEVSPEAELEEAEVKGPLYRSLGKSPGWDLLDEVVRAQAQGRLNQLIMSLSPEEGVDGFSKILSQEYEKGVRAGMLMVIDLPAWMEEFFSARAKELRMQLYPEDEE